MKTLIFIILLQTILIVSKVYAESSLPDQTFGNCLNDYHYRFGDPNIPVADLTYGPKHPLFLTVLKNYVRNLRFYNDSTRKPVLIVTAGEVSHVQGAILCAKARGLELRIRSGGHDYDGLSYNSDKDFVLLDMSNLRSIEFDPSLDTAWVGAGATLGELYYVIANKSDVKAFPAGLCPGLGTGGHFSGGGYGAMMRKYGLSVDNIVDAQFIDVNGKALDRNSMGEDLFWALRGGGAASFGVVMAWKIKLVPVPEKVTVFTVSRTVEDGATNIILKWQEVSDKIDNDLFIRLTLSVTNATKSGKTVKGTFTGMFLGGSEKLLEVMNSGFPELGLNKTDCTEMKWIESVLYMFSIPKDTPTSVLLERIPKQLIYLKRKSDYVQEPIPKTGLESIFEVMAENEKVSMAWNPYGGRMSEISDKETPFPHRAGNKFLIQYSANWFEPGNDIADVYLNQTERLFEAMGPYVSKNPREAFLNYRDIDIGTNANSTYDEGKVYGTKYFKNNFERLVSVKTRVDPDNYFRYEQSIPVRSG
ncbi:PREDICTED: berberine bridge enzyme-like 4 [Tarenaya hassleriana]|uniref:berberine bridge enzyme-like 4 n=1 Tax=Tarenaya hassleriana TaxID=28532 RepID=UPI00053C0978|nr:PREDICTED: berberine bridge enzyme-like 4 [Tarenaya hassleriana]